MTTVTEPQEKADARQIDLWTRRPENPFGNHKILGTSPLNSWWTLSPPWPCWL